MTYRNNALYRKTRSYFIRPDIEPVKTLSRVGLDIVSGCQLKCPGCPNSRSDKIEYMDNNIFETCLKNMDVERVKLFRLFNFGEPLLHPYIVDYLIQLMEQPYFQIDHVEISTNGQYLNKITLNEIFEDYLIDYLYLSCDGNGSPKEYERLRYPGKWDKLWRFVDYVTAIHAKHPKEINFVARICCETEEGKERWRNLFPDSWTLEFRDWHNLSGSKENPSGRKSYKGYGICTYLRDTDKLYINSQGKVVSCCAHPDAWVLGDLTKNKYSEIINSKKRHALLHLMKKRPKSINNVCNECEII